MPNKTSKCRAGRSVLGEVPCSPGSQAPSMYRAARMAASGDAGEGEFSVFKTTLGALVEAASAPYRGAGRFPWHFARGKLSRDPIFTEIVARGLIPDGARIVDLGCGLGLLASWLAAAQTLWARALWPATWPPPPRLESYHGIERVSRDAERARGIFGASAITCGDIRTSPFGPASVVVIFDVLHYIDSAAQDDVLVRVRNALSPHGGLLLLRVGDAAAGWRFRVTLWVDRVITSIHGRHRQSLHCRPLEAWLARLRALGFYVTPMPMSAGTPFANVLIVARLPAARA